MLELTHMQAAAIFAFFTSVVFAITTKDSNRERLLYGAYCFAWFALGTIAAAWLMAGLRWLAAR